VNVSLRQITKNISDRRHESRPCSRYGKVPTALFSKTCHMSQAQKEINFQKMCVEQRTEAKNRSSHF